MTNLDFSSAMHFFTFESDNEPCKTKTEIGKYVIKNESFTCCLPGVLFSWPGSTAGDRNV